MAKNSAAGTQTKDIRASWTKARRAWHRTETSLAALFEANNLLLHNLGKAGASASKKAKAELNSTIKKLDHARQSARKQFDKLMAHHATVAHVHTAQGPRKTPRKASSKRPARAVRPA